MVIRNLSMPWIRTEREGNEAETPAQATMQEMLLKVLPLLRKTLPKRITKS